MNTMLDKLSTFLNDKNITFNKNNQHVRCLAHIINLSAQKALVNLYISRNDDDDVDADADEDKDTNNELLSVIFKLRKLVIKICASPQRRERFQQQCVAT